MLDYFGQTDVHRGEGDPWDKNQHVRWNFFKLLQHLSEVLYNPILNRNKFTHIIQMFEFVNEI